MGEFEEGRKAYKYLAVSGAAVAAVRQREFVFCRGCKKQCGRLVYLSFGFSPGCSRSHTALLLTFRRLCTPNSSYFPFRGPVALFLHELTVVCGASLANLRCDSLPLQSFFFSSRRRCRKITFHLYQLQRIASYRLSAPGSFHATEWLALSFHSNHSFTDLHPWPALSIAVEGGFLIFTPTPVVMRINKYCSQDRNSR